jgi:hypothetical protein
MALFNLPLVATLLTLTVYRDSWVSSATLVVARQLICGYVTTTGLLPNKCRSVFWTSGISAHTIFSEISSRVWDGQIPRACGGQACADPQSCCDPA